MREFLNSILGFIGATSLTQIEFDSLDLDIPTYSVEVYQGLLGVLNSRDLVSPMQKRLQYYFLARGVTVGAPDTAKSNIFIGASLCD